MTEALSEVAGDRLNEAILDKVVRNASSSWTQSGHLRGRSRKTRQRVRATPAAAAYALLLGFACGSRGSPPVRDSLVFRPRRHGGRVCWNWL